MKALALLVLVVLAACSAVQAPVTTVEYRAIQGACKPYEDQIDKLTKERDEWKRYAKKLERLP